MDDLERLAAEGRYARRPTHRASGIGCLTLLQIALWSVLLLGVAGAVAGWFWFTTPDERIKFNQEHGGKLVELIVRLAVPILSLAMVTIFIVLVISWGVSRGIRNADRRRHGRD